MTDPKCIPNNNIKFSDIYNVLNDASAPGGTNHNGSDPISISNFVSATHPSTDTMAALTGDVDRKFNFISNEPTEVNEKYAKEIKINANSSDIYHDLLETSYRFFDTGGESNEYGNNENKYITFDAGSGNFVWINIKNYNIENGYDFLYILAANSSSNFDNLSEETAPELSQHLPNSYISGTISTLQLNTWYKINTQYVKFRFTSDGSVTRSGWDIYLVSSGIFPETNDSGLVPKNWIQLSNNFGENIIENNGSIILNSTTKNKLYTPISRFTFSDGPNNLPSYNNTSVNGSIIFDAGEGNSWKIDVGKYTFPYSASGFNLFGQLKIESKANESDYFSNIEKPGLAKVNYGQRFPSNLKWTTPGNVFPSYNGSPSYYIFEDGSSALGTSGSPLLIDERYIKFTYDNNVDNSNYAGTFKGWLFTLQVIDSNGNDTENVYNNGDTITDQEVSIKKDFLGRCKNHDPSMQIVEYDGNYTTDISKNSALGDLRIGLKMPIGAYNLSSSDITIIGGDDNMRVNGFSFTDGDTSTYFFITPPTDALAHKIIIRVKGNTFYNLPEKIWNKPADNDFCWYWNMPIITISSTSVNLDASTNSQRIPINISCQHNFDISNLLLESGLSNAVLDGEPVFDGSKNATFYIIANNPSSTDISTNVNINIPKEAMRELDSGYFYNPIDISGFSYYYEPDTTRPTLVISYDGTNNLGAKTITFTFSEQIKSFDVNYISVTAKTETDTVEITNEAITNLTGPTGEESNIYTAVFTPPPNTEIPIIFTISVPAGIIYDLNNNPMTSSSELNIEMKSIDPTMIEILKSESDTVRRSPFDGLYDYSQFGVIYYSQELIDAANKVEIDITRGCLITSFFFQYRGWTGGYTVNNQTVKISHTEATQIERGPDGGGSSYVEVNYSELDLKDTTIVKGGEERGFTFILNNTDEIGWKEISDDNKDPNLAQLGFDTPFMWNGTSNILISWENRDGSWTSGYGGLIGGGGKTMRSHSWFSDDSYPTRASSENSQVPNIRFIVIPN